MHSRIWLVFLFLGLHPLQAQIEQVTFTWQTPLCPVSCEQALNKQLSKINGVAQVSIPPGSGSALLVWKPNVAFSFFPLNAATRMVGIRIHDVHLKVKGTIDGGNNTSLRLRSVGDNTVFNLISPPQAPLATDAVALYNPQAYPLSPTVREQLAEPQRVRKPVTIEGMLLEPERGPPLYLVVEKVTLDEKKKP